MKLAVAYYRVSTVRQGESGLGLEAQREAVGRYAESQGFTILEEFTEIESGRRNKRPCLAEALQRSRSGKATLIIAKLDRLARNLLFIASLIESKVDFVAVDNPQANKPMLQMLAVFAEFESDQIRIRVREALSAAKRRGVELGKNGKKLAEAHKIAASAYASGLAPELARLEREGFTTCRAKVAELNRRGIPSREGGKWHLRNLFLAEQRIAQVKLPPAPTERSE